MLADVEAIDLAAGGTYDITVADGVATPGRLDFSAHGPVAIDASAETDSRIVLSAGAGGFDFIGGGSETASHRSPAADDQMVGGGGARQQLSIRGGGVFRFTANRDGVEAIAVGSLDPGGGGIALVTPTAPPARRYRREQRPGSYASTAAGRPTVRCSSGNHFAADTLIGGKGDDPILGGGAPT